MQVSAGDWKSKYCALQSFSHLSSKTHIGMGYTRKYFYSKINVSGFGEKVCSACTTHQNPPAEMWLRASPAAEVKGDRSWQPNLVHSWSFLLLLVHNIGHCWGSPRERTSPIPHAPASCRAWPEAGLAEGPLTALLATARGWWPVPEHSCPGQVHFWCYPESGRAAMHLATPQMLFFPDCTSGSSEWLSFPSPMPEVWLGS